MWQHQFVPLTRHTDNQLRGRTLGASHTAKDLGSLAPDLRGTSSLALSSSPFAGAVQREDWPATCPSRFVCPAPQQKKRATALIIVTSGVALALSRRVIVRISNLERRFCCSDELDCAFDQKDTSMNRNFDREFDNNNRE
jgi:hypothetical protein